jgi:hypothetical protein
MAKGQIHQLFIFLMAILVIGATVIIGTKLFVQVEGTSCETRAVSFTQELKEQLDKQATLGSRGKIEIRSPCDSQELCFIDSRMITDPSNSIPFTSKHPAIQSAVRANITTNIFLVGKETRPAGFEKKVILSNPNQEELHTDLCINATGSKFYLMAEGYGRYVKLGQVP